MNNRTAKNRDEEAWTLRQFKVLVVVLILSNVILGTFGFYLLRSMDRKYSTLINQSVPALTELRTLTVFSLEAMRSTSPTLSGDTPQTRQEGAQRARVALERDRNLRNHVLRQDWLSRNGEARVNFEQAGEAFSQATKQVILLLESGQSSEGDQQREQIQRPAFNRYVAATTKAADMLEAESLQMNATLTETTGSASGVLIGFASWPLMIVGLLLAVTTLFVLGVLVNVYFRREEAM